MSDPRCRGRTSFLRPPAHVRSAMDRAARAFRVPGPRASRTLLHIPRIRRCAAGCRCALPVEGRHSAAAAVQGLHPASGSDRTVRLKTPAPQGAGSRCDHARANTGPGPRSDVRSRPLPAREQVMRDRSLTARRVRFGARPGRPGRDRIATDPGRRHGPDAPAAGFRRSLSMRPYLSLFSTRSRCAQR